MNPYRTPSRRLPPACPHCTTAAWLFWDVMWAVWICLVCDTWVEPYKDEA